MSQESLTALLGKARLEPYLKAAGGDASRALELYLWATELAGALHAQTSFVEVAVRNAIDARLSEWNDAQGPEYTAAWTADGATAPLLYGLLGGELRTARSWAGKEAERRSPGHLRHSSGVTHDDVIAQLMFGAWVKLIRPMSRTESQDSRQKLWSESLRHAFPNAEATDESRIAIGAQLETLRRLRNRIAHHDNLLGVEVNRRFRGMLSLLAKIDRSYPDLAAARSRLRRLHREDPRRAW